ncbi:Ribosomal RNA small subunit methyltransferase A [Geodia barretti]|nr:Ribosomal RNA small subunit methyltransferase A [Geodia barretti]
MTLMFQKEVAQRITATGGRDYGGLSVRAQWLCTCERLFDVGPRAFVPPPAVTPRWCVWCRGPRRSRRRTPTRSTP